MRRTSLLAYIGIALAALACRQEHIAPHSAREAENQPFDPDFSRAPGAPEEVEADFPDEAAQFRYEQRLSEDGTLPLNALLTALTQRAALLNAQPEEAGISPTSWQWLGPGNIGGRARAILVHPAQPNVLWVGAVTGGVWKTVNSGASWFPLNDFAASLSADCLALDPQNPEVLLVGTGEGFRTGTPGSSNTAVMQGAGVFKSTDGGSTWFHLESTTGADWYFVNRLAFSPADSSIILAATGNGIFRSTDGGATWSQRTTARTLDVRFHPTDGALAVAGRDNGLAQYSLDGGLSWSNATGIPNGGRVEVRYTLSNPNIVYASVTRNGGEIWRSTNGGQSYTLRNTGTVYLSSSSSWASALWVDPTNSETLIVGGLNLWRSFDGGLTLTRISQWQAAPQSAHADHHAIVSDPGFDGLTNKRVYFGNDGGVYRTDDVYAVTELSGWIELNNQLGITQFYGAAVNPATGVVIGGTQDNGTLRYIGGTESWTTMFGGDGGFCAADPGDPNYFYGEYVYCQLHRSTNGGQSANWIYNGIGDAGSSATANFVSPFELDPNNSNRMLAGAARLWKSANVKEVTPSWTPIKNSVGSNISAIAIAEGDNNIVWVGHNDGRIYRTPNALVISPTWLQVDNNPAGLPNRWCSKIVIDPADHQHVYVSFMGYQPNNVWRTNDNGANWAQITGVPPAALPSIPVSSVAMHGTQPGWLYVGTDIGVFASENDGQTWTVPNGSGPLSDGPANVEIDELLWKNDNTLIAATHGRGIYSATIVPPCTPANGDADCNGHVDLLDFAAFAGCLAGPNASPGPSCGAFDFGADADVDLGDFAAFQNGFTG